VAHLGLTVVVLLAYSGLQYGVRGWTWTGNTNSTEPTPHFISTQVALHRYESTDFSYHNVLLLDCCYRCIQDSRTSTSVLHFRRSTLTTQTSRTSSLGPWESIRHVYSLVQIQQVRALVGRIHKNEKSNAS